MRKRTLVVGVVLLMLIGLSQASPVGACEPPSMSLDCTKVCMEITTAVPITTSIALHVDGSPVLGPVVVDIPAGHTVVCRTWAELGVDLLDCDVHPVALVTGIGTVEGSVGPCGECPPPPPPGDEGCTPGYWRNHFDSWPPTGLSPEDDFDTTFDVDYFDPDITLGEAIWLGGGGVRKLARHGTAALLSALHPSVGYRYTSDEVIAFVQAGNARPLVKANELGCPID